MNPPVWPASILWAFTSAACFSADMRCLRTWEAVTSMCTRFCSAAWPSRKKNLERAVAGPQ